MIYECEKCRDVLLAGAQECPKCGDKFDEAVPQDAGELRRGWQARSEVPAGPQPSVASAHPGTRPDAHARTPEEPHSSRGRQHSPDRDYWQSKLQQAKGAADSALQRPFGQRLKRNPFLVLVALLLVILMLTSIRLVVLNATRPTFLGRWENTVSMALPGGTYDTSEKVFTFNPDGTGTAEGGGVTGSYGESPQLKKADITWISGEDTKLGMNDEPIIVVRYNNLPADSGQMTFHWSISDDHKTLKLENEEYTRVDQ